MSVAITGWGIVSSMGNNVEENLQSLKAERTGIAFDEEIDIRKGRFLGRVRLSDEEMSNELGLSAPISRTALLGMYAAKEAWGQKEIPSSLRCGVISGTTVGGMDLTEQTYRNFSKNGEWDDLNVLWQHDNGFSTDQIGNYLQINDYRTTLSTACSSAANAIMMGANLIKTKQLDRVLVGGVDALTYFTINGFDSLMIFDAELCKPFDARRKGLNLGEGAAYIVLESEESLKQTKNQPIGYFLGGSNVSDAYHQTASSPDGYGATQAILGAIDEAGISKEDISYVNAHGTGTNNNDLSESVALKNVFGENVPPFSSTKCYTGHTLGAAGSIEAVYSLLSLSENLMFSNLRFRDKIEETNLTPITDLRSEEVNYVLSNSFGFGGNNTALIFGKSH